MQIKNKIFSAQLIHHLVPLYLLMILILGGCASAPANNRMVPDSRRKEYTQPSTHRPDIEGRLRRAGRIWRHTPHRMGGHDKQGIDCSGLTQVLYEELFGIHLPRATWQQVKKGLPVDRSKLAAGDLVFFRPPGKKGHVGIYLGKGEFLHTSTHHGVMVSHLEENYWRQCYWTARRVLAPESTAN